MGNSFDEEPFLGEKNLANVLLALGNPVVNLSLADLGIRKKLLGKLVVSRLIGR